MPSLTTCLKQAGDFLPAELRTAILNRAEELRQQGIPESEVARRAVAEVQGDRQTMLGEVESALKSGAILYEDPAPITQQQAAKVEAEAIASRVDQVLTEFPNLKVRAEEGGEAMPASEFLAAARADAARDMQDGDLLMTAVQCAMTNGV